jgi:hypothetical protein
MSESSPQPSRDRTPIYLALIAATSTIIAALIAVLPNILNTNQRGAPPQQPTVIVVTATLAPATEAPIATATTPPAATTAALGQPGATLAGPSPTTDTRITFLLLNNFDKNQDFYIDSNLAISVNSGQYQTLHVQPGSHELKNCLLGSDPTVKDNCFAQTANVNQNPYLWQIDGNAPVTDQPILVVLNQANSPQDVFVDNSNAGTVSAHDFMAIRVPVGSHSLQPCTAGNTPASNPNACGAFTGLDAHHPVISFTINP